MSAHMRTLLGSVYVSYSFSHVPDKTKGLVRIDPVTGEVRLTGVLDYEEAACHELDVQAKDGGGQSSHCKLIIDVIGENDSAPVIVIKSNCASVPEDTSPGTMVALLHVYDLDAGTSGQVTCYCTYPMLCHLNLSHRLNITSRL